MAESIITEIITELLKPLFGKKSQKDALLETDWFEKSCKKADEEAIANLREMLGKNAK
jgi:hypothetical protein